MKDKKIDEEELSKIIELSFPVMAAIKVGNLESAHEFAREAEEKGIVVEI